MEQVLGQVTPESVAPVKPTYEQQVEVANRLKLDDITPVKQFKVLLPMVQALIEADLTKRITAKIAENVGTALNAVNERLQLLPADILADIRQIMKDNEMLSVNLTITPDTLAVVRSLKTPAATRTAGGNNTGNGGKYTYSVNGEIVVGKSEAVAIKLGIDTDTDTYKNDNAWRQIASKAKESGAIITRTNVEKDGVVEEFAPVETIKTKAQVWFAQA